MSNVIKIEKELSIFDSDFEVHFQLKQLPNKYFYCKSWVKYDINGCELFDHEFNCDGSDLFDYDFEDSIKHEIIQAIEDYFQSKHAEDYLQKYESDAYYYYEQCKEDESIENKYY
jgi:hypothetical protein